MITGRTFTISGSLKPVLKSHISTIRGSGWHVVTNGDDVHLPWSRDARILLCPEFIVPKQLKHFQLAPVLEVSHGSC
jgi:hypothetical protein